MRYSQSPGPARANAASKHKGDLVAPCDLFAKLFSPVWGKQSESLLLPYIVLKNKSQMDHKSEFCERLHEAERVPRKTGEHLHDLPLDKDVYKAPPPQTNVCLANILSFRTQP